MRINVLAFVCLVASTTACSSSDDTKTTLHPDAGSPSSGDAGAFPEPEPDECVNQVTAGLHELTCGGDWPKYSVNVPEVCLEQACGVIVDVHGGGMSADQQNLATDLRALGEEHGYIVINPTKGDALGTSLWSPNDDVAVLDFLNRVVGAFHADEARLHFTGFSQGGSMSWRFVCKHADRFASVAPSSESPNCGGFPSIDIPCFQESFPGDSTPTNGRTHVLYQHGELDALQAFTCATTTRNMVVERWLLGAEEIVATGSGFERTRHAGDDGLVFEFVHHTYSSPGGSGQVLAGHCLPGDTFLELPPTMPYQPLAMSCENSEYTWGQEVIRFFMEHPKL